MQFPLSLCLRMRSLFRVFEFLWHITFNGGDFTASMVYWLCMVDVPLTLRMHKKPNSLAWMQRHLSVLIHLWWLYVCACFVLSRNSVPFHSILSHFPRSWILWFYCLIYLPRIDIAKGEISNMISIDNERLFHSRLSQCVVTALFFHLFIFSPSHYFIISKWKWKQWEKENERKEIKRS